ncbi:hypothetical protein K3728_01265 [Rhodobacteraceae bacterium M385]|nr:hypothetical protein K3728_01265 [Rhodobacteraceae bacterium M385]
MIGQYLDRTASAEEKASKREFYTEVQVHEIASEFGVRSELLGQFAAHLEHAARRWSVCRQRGPVNVGDTRAALKDLSKSLSATTKKMRSMPDEVWRDIGEAPQEPDNAPNDYLVHRARLEDEAYSEVTISAEIGPRHCPSRASISEIVAMLDALSERAFVVEQMDGHLFGQRGPKRDAAFNDWVRQIRIIWCGTFDREFTYDVIEGKAVSDAARFCWAAFGPLDTRHTEEETIKKLRSFLEYDRKNKDLHI